MNNHALFADAASAIETLRTALRDCLVVMDNELDGLKVIQPERESARFALEVTASIAELAVLRLEGPHMQGDEDRPELLPAGAGATRNSAPGECLGEGDRADLAVTIPWEMGEHRVFAQWALANFQLFVSKPALAQAWKQGQRYERARAERDRVLNEVHPRDAASCPDETLANQLKDAVSILQDLHLWVRSRQHISRIDALLRRVRNPDLG